MLNIRFIIKMLGMMFILETLFMLAATAVAFLYEGNDFYPLLQSSGIMFGTGVLFMLIGLRANEHTAGRREGMLTVTLTWALFSLLGMLPFYLGALRRLLFSITILARHIFFRPVFCVFGGSHNELTAR